MQLQQYIGLNTLDILLLFVLFLGIVIGFVRGARTQIISAASIWLGLLITLWLYRLLSNDILQGLGLPKIGSDTLAFLGLLFVCFHTVRLIVKSLTVPPEEKKKPVKKRGAVGPPETPSRTAVDRFVWGPLSALGGMAMGFVLTALWTAIILGVLQFTFQVDVTEVAGVQNPGRGIGAQLRGSTLIYYFNEVLRLLVRSLSFFVIDSSPNLLEIVINKISQTGGGGG